MEAAEADAAVAVRQVAGLVGPGEQHAAGSQGHLRRRSAALGIVGRVRHGAPVVGSRGEDGEGRSGMGGVKGSGQGRAAAAECGRVGVGVRAGVNRRAGGGDVVKEVVGDVEWAGCRGPLRRGGDGGRMRVCGSGGEEEEQKNQDGDKGEHSRHHYSSSLVNIPPAFLNVAATVAAALRLFDVVVVWKKKDKTRKISRWRRRHCGGGFSSSCMPARQEAQGTNPSCGQKYQYLDDMAFDHWLHLSVQSHQVPAAKNSIDSFGTRI